MPERDGYCDRNAEGNQQDPRCGESRLKAFKFEAYMYVDSMDISVKACWAEFRCNNSRGLSHSGKARLLREALSIGSDHVQFTQVGSRDL